MSAATPITSRVLPAVLANVKHGSHLCAFYETKDDLLDLVLPFFAEGLNRRELCVWLMPNSVRPDEIKVHLNAAAAGRELELYSGRQFYFRGSNFAPEPVVRFWNEKVQQALASHHSGLRASGDAFWLQANDWEAFLDYETYLNKAIAEKPFSLLCTFPLSVSKAGDVLEVARAHDVAIARRKRTWEVIKGWGSSEAPLGHEQKRAEALDSAARILSLSNREVIAHLGRKCPGGAGVWAR